MKTWRIDTERHWDSAKLELLPLETRKVDFVSGDRVQVYLPADSVLFLELTELK